MISSINKIRIVLNISKFNCSNQKAQFIMEFGVIRFLHYCILFVSYTKWLDLLVGGRYSKYIAFVNI